MKAQSEMTRWDLTRWEGPRWFARIQVRLEILRLRTRLWRLRLQRRGFHL